MSTHQGQGWFRSGKDRFPLGKAARWGVMISSCLLLVPSSGFGQGQRPTQAMPHYPISPGTQLRNAQPQPGQQAPRRPAAAAPAQQDVLPAGGPYLQPHHAGPVIQQVQNSAESARAVHHLIEAMPTSMEDLDLIEKRSQLIITKANIVRMAIADQAILDVAQYSPREISLIGLIRGSTTLTIWFEGHDDPLIYLIKVIRDPNLDDQRRIDYGKLERKLAVLFPNSKVYLIPMNFKIIVRGQARDQEEAANILNIIQGEIISQDGSLWGNQPNLAANGFGAGDSYFNQVGAGGFGGNWAGFIVNELRVPGEYQINVRCVVAELNRSQARNYGLDFNVLFANGRHLITSTMGAANGNLAGVFENGEIGVFVNWLATNGTAKILTQPNTTVLSGRQARFLAGGEFAVPTVVGIAGAAGQTTTFRGFGTSMLVTPTVADRDLIRLNAIAEFSQLNAGNSVNSIPGLDTRRIETTVELREGQTLVLAGLLSRTQAVVKQRVPFLGNIPKIGEMLFTNKTATEDETELLILVTPEIVRPMDANEVPPVPGFEVTHPNDYEFWKYGMTEGVPDTGYYQLPPYGSGSVGTNVGYQHFNSGPADSLNSPVPTANGLPFSYGVPMENNMPVNNGIPMNNGGYIPADPSTVIPAAPPVEAAPNFGLQTEMPIPPSPSVGQSAGALPAASTQANRQPVAPVNGRPNTVRQAGWSTPKQQAASPQAIVPMNHSAPSTGNLGKSVRIRRDQHKSSRY